MKYLTVADCTRLHAGVTLPAVIGILAEQARQIERRRQRLHWAHADQNAPQFSGVFNRHARALRQIRQHGVRRVAEQRHPPLRVFARAAHRRPDAQGPESPIVDDLNQILQGRAGRAHVAAQIECIGTVVPILELTVDATVHNRDHIEPLTAAHRILHHMQLRSEPRGHLLAAQVRGQTALRHQRPVGQMAGRARSAIVQQLPAHLAPQSVRTD